MTNRTDSIASFFLYGIGLVAFLIADIRVSEIADKVYVADWAFVKSVVLIAGSACMLGYDQLFVRDPSLIERKQSTIVIQVLLISIGSSALLYGFKNLSVEHGLLLFSSIALFGFLNYTASAHRGLSNLWKAQLATNFWKVLVATVLLSFSLSPFYTFLIALFVSSVIVVGVGMPRYERGLDSPTWEAMGTADARALSRSFFLSNLTLLIASHGEQLIINVFGDYSASATLFSHMAVFAPISIGMNGFLGFYLGPKIRRMGRITRRSYMNLTMSMTLYSFVITVVSVVAGCLYVVFLSNRTLADFSPLIVALVAATGVVRGVYVATSVCVGIYGDKRALRRLVYEFWVGTFIYLLLTGITMRFSNGIMAAQIMAVLALFNWTYRWAASHRKSLKVLTSV